MRHTVVSEGIAHVAPEPPRANRTHFLSNASTGYSHWVPSSRRRTHTRRVGVVVVRRRATVGLQLHTVRLAVVLVFGLGARLNVAAGPSLVDDRVHAALEVIGEVLLFGSRSADGLIAGVDGLPGLLRVIVIVLGGGIVWTAASLAILQTLSNRHHNNFP